MIMVDQTSERFWAFENQPINCIPIKCQNKINSQFFSRKEKQSIGWCTIIVAFSGGQKHCYFCGFCFYRVCHYQKVNSYFQGRNQWKLLARNRVFSFSLLSAISTKKFWNVLIPFFADFEKKTRKLRRNNLLVMR